MRDESIGRVGWVPIFGEFDISQDKVISFKGKRIILPAPGKPPGAEDKEQPSLGLLLSSQSISDGKLTAKVLFENVTQDSFCELVVSYNQNPLHLITAGLGGEPFALYSVREFGGPRTKGQGWWNYNVAGDRSALRAGGVYQIEARFYGALVSLLINGVLVGTSEVTSPMGRFRQVGLLCRGEHLITIQDFKVESNKPKAFIVMQLGNDYEDIYEDVVKEVCKDYEVNPLRADEVAGPGLIIADIAREISSSQLVIADITPINPNVYFEVGYSIALGKPMILLAKKGTALPFDVAGFRVLFYEDTIGGKNRLEEGLRKHLDAILSI